MDLTQVDLFGQASVLFKLVLLLELYLTSENDCSSKKDSEGNGTADGGTVRLIAGTVQTYLLTHTKQSPRNQRSST